MRRYCCIIGVCFSFPVEMLMSLRDREELPGINGLPGPSNTQEYPSDNGA